MNEERDIRTIEFSQILSILEPRPPFSRLGDCWGTVCVSQKAHMVNWFAMQDRTGKGAYSRKKANDSTRAAYNRLQNAGALLWIAEVLGEDAVILQKAVDAARIAEDRNYRGTCKAFREIIPFDRIWELLCTPEGWLIDDAMAGLLVQDEENGEPYVPDENMEAYMGILKKELG